MKKCPYCAEEIHDEATKCKHCREWLNRDSYELSEKIKVITHLSTHQLYCVGY